MITGGATGEEEDGGVITTDKVRLRDKDSPTTSNPGPMFAEVAGTRIVKDRDAMAKGCHKVEGDEEQRIHFFLQSRAYGDSFSFWPRVRSAQSSG